MESVAGSAKRGIFVRRPCALLSHVEIEVQIYWSHKGALVRRNIVLFSMLSFRGPFGAYIIITGGESQNAGNRVAEPGAYNTPALYRGPAAKRDQCSGPRRRTGSVFPGWPDQCSLVGPRPPRRIPSRTARATRCIAHVNARQVAALANRHGRTFECLRVWNVGKSKRKAIFRPGLSQTGAKFALRLATH